MEKPILAYMHTEWKRKREKEGQRVAEGGKERERERRREEERVITSGFKINSGPLTI